MAIDTAIIKTPKHKAFIKKAEKSHLHFRLRLSTL